VPDAPVAYDLDAAGNPVPSQVVRIDGVRWDEAPSLYAAGPAQVFTVRLGEDGSVVDDFGDGVQGARLPTGRNNVTAVYRVGGGAVGEVPAGAISSLLGSVRGVKKVVGAGPTSGGADQDDERRLRSLVPGRARAFARAVSIEDLADLALAFPGVTHSASWVGAGPPGCACGGTGIHLAFLRASGDGPRAPLGPEVQSLAAYLDGRRDVSVPICVCAGTATPLTIAATLAVDPRRAPADVVTAAREALLDPDGPLAPLERELGQPLDRSDVLGVLHAATGVVGVSSLTLPGAAGDVGRRAAARYELLLAGDAELQGVAA
jgi:predicted phage baseplate assembly protein